MCVYLCPRSELVPALNLPLNSLTSLRAGLGESLNPSPSYPVQSSTKESTQINSTQQVISVRRNEFMYTEYDKYTHLGYLLVCVHWVVGWLLVLRPAKPSLNTTFSQPPRLLQLSTVPSHDYTSTY